MNKKGGIKIWLVFAYAIAIFSISVLLLAGSAMGDISRNGLVAEWHFDGDAKDSSGNGNDGTVNVNKFADGKLGKALSLNGGSDFVDFGEGKGKLDFGKAPFSMEFWMNYQGRTVHPYVTDIMGKTSGQADSPGYFAWTTTWGGDGSNYGIFVATSTASWGNGNAEHWGAYLPNNWYHIALVRDGTTWKIFKDGVFVYSQTKDGIGLNVDNDATFKMGESTREPNFQGLLDEVRVYNRALSADEIKTNFKAGQITITSTPSGAEVFVDGSSKGIASPSLSMNGISAGTYSVKCKLSGYTDSETNVVLSASSAASVECKLKLAPTPTTPTPIKKTTGSISISSLPSGANIYLDGDLKGVTPKIITDVSEGTHYIELTFRDHKKWAVDINVETERTSPLSVSLVPEATETPEVKNKSILPQTPTPNIPNQVQVTGIIIDTITNQPVSGATVIIGDVSDVTGSDGKFELRVDPSKDSIMRVTRNEYEPATRSVDVPESGTRVDLYLTPISKSFLPPISWYWILGILLIGLIAAGGIFVYKGKKHVSENCQKCGAKIPDDANFCEECGEPR